MAPLASPKAFFLSTLWTVAATSSGVPVVSTQGYKMSYITFTDRINLIV